jgi:hypothetical protein
MRIWCVLSEEVDESSRVAGWESSICGILVEG